MKGPTAVPPGWTLSGEIRRLDRVVDSAATGTYAERRIKPRMRHSFPTRVSGVDTEGRKFSLEVGLENISSSGLYLRMPREVKSGDMLNVLVRFSNGKPGAMAAVVANVLRVEPGVDGLNGIAMAIKQYEFV
jgi:PilZ domain